jgi:hypothetical protein
VPARTADRDNCQLWTVENKLLEETQRRIHVTENKVPSWSTLSARIGLDSVAAMQGFGRTNANYQDCRRPEVAEAQCAADTHCAMGWVGAPAVRRAGVTDDPPRPLKPLSTRQEPPSGGA